MARYPPIGTCALCASKELAKDSEGGTITVCESCLNHHNVKCEASRDEVVMMLYVVVGKEGEEKMVGYCTNCMSPVLDSLVKERHMTKVFPVNCPEHLIIRGIVTGKDFDRRPFYIMKMYNQENLDLIFFHYIDATHQEHP